MHTRYRRTANKVHAMKLKDGKKDIETIQTMQIHTDIVWMHRQKHRYTIHRRYNLATLQM
jgi:hypothetical protein